MSMVLRGVFVEELTVLHSADSCCPCSDSVFLQPCTTKPHFMAEVCRSSPAVTDSSLTKATLDEASDSSDGSGVCLMFPPVYKGDEAGGVQTALCSGMAVSQTGLQPRLLEAEPGWRPPAWVCPQKQADDVPGRLADALEKGGGATQQHIGHHAYAPQVRAQRHRLSKDQLWGGKLRAAQQRVNVVGTVELDSITKVCEFDHWLAAGAVGHQQDQGVAAGGFKRVYQADYVGVLKPLEQTEFLLASCSPV
ncbi:hypothetical protein FQN60_007727 [Etheostoma spectabile]|uniref:Uncharacterized protein n=1 Tax=Etheostoma spectabile TaxID=54343 RepID=A0A5J5CUK5_9PERO|nr:hypothetical protein FQN60_007727 [Etheostoma spectabile]